MNYVARLATLSALVLLSACANQHCRVTDPANFNKLIRDSDRITTAQDLVFAYYTNPEIRKERFVITTDTIAPNKFRITANEDIRDDDEISTQKTVFIALHFTNYWQVSNIEICDTFIDR